MTSLLAGLVGGFAAVIFFCAAVACAILIAGSRWPEED